MHRPGVFTSASTERKHDSRTSPRSDLNLRHEYNINKGLKTLEMLK